MIELSEEEKIELERRHRTERDRRVADRIKAVLLSNEGWKPKEIAQALRIHKDTVFEHIIDYKKEKKLNPENGGSQSKLDEEQTKELIAHLESHTYQIAQEICAYVESKYGMSYSRQGMTDWLHAHKFSHKKPKGVPAKANAQKQEAFIKYYENLTKKTPEEEPIVFLDAVHPTMATKITSGWIRSGKDKLIETTASRTRMNLLGSLNLAMMDITHSEHETINAEALEKHFDLLTQKHPEAKKIHVILDNGPYNTCEATKEAAERRNIILHFLPTYSPNLNAIEPVWKLMNEYTRNNVFFASAKDFREAIRTFFNVTWPSIAQSMIDRINDNFRVLGKAP